MRENAADKGRRYLAEGRLVVTVVQGDKVRARCRGAGAEYRLGHQGGHWYCNCFARATCSHLHALQLVTAVPREEA